MVPNTRRHQGVQITDRETTDSKIKLSINQRKPVPPPKQENTGFKKLALNIVHAVEFSRNGRTRVTVARRGPISRGCSVLHPVIRWGPIRTLRTRTIESSSGSGLFVPLEEEKLSRFSRSCGATNEYFTYLRGLLQLGPASRACRPSFRPFRGIRAPRMRWAPPLHRPRRGGDRGHRDPLGAGRPREVDGEGLAGGVVE